MVPLIIGGDVKRHRAIMDLHEFIAVGMALPGPFAGRLALKIVPSRWQDSAALDP